MHAVKLNMSLLISRPRFMANAEIISANLTFYIHLHNTNQVISTFYSKLHDSKSCILLNCIVFKKVSTN
jgi:hypothetical protein